MNGLVLKEEFFLGGSITLAVIVINLAANYLSFSWAGGLKVWTCFFLFKAKKGLGKKGSNWDFGKRSVITAWKGEEITVMEYPKLPENLLYLMFTL